MTSSQENDVYFFGEIVEKIGAQEIQDHQRRLLHLRAADAALGPARRHRRPEHRSLHAAEQRDPQREGRAAALPAGALLPDEGGRPRDRLPDPDLRRLVAARPDHPQRVLLGHQSQPGRDVLHDWFSKTGRASGGEYRYNRGGGSDGMVTAYWLDQHAATYAPTTAHGARRRRAATSPRHRQSDAARDGCGARARVDYFSSIATNQTFNTNVYDASRNQRYLWRQRRRRLAHATR